jgi:cell division protease FtsH
MKPLIKNLLIVLIIFLLLGGILGLFSDPFQDKKEVSLTKLVERINKEEVKEITISGNDISVLYKDQTQAEAKKESEIALSESLLNYGVEKEALQKIDINPKETGEWIIWLGPILLILLPFLLFIFIFWNLNKNAKTGAMQAFNFSKAKARLFGAEGHKKEKTTFKDVAGLQEVKDELKEVVEFLKTPKKFLKMGARIPRGVLLMGPPGCGKTLLARAVAGEGNVPFFSISGSEFVEMFVGVGASRVRDLFNTAKKSAPSILFIDELDAVGRHRGTGVGGGHDEREQTLNQILVEMDGFEKNTNVIVVAATNRPDTLDPALLRPGRFDRRMVLDLPDINDRKAVLKIHGKGKPISNKVNLREIAERTPGFSGADLANLMNEAAILSARKNKKEISQEELLQSIDKVLLGPERKSHILSNKEKKITAYHESGHALTATLLPYAEPIRKISIIARGKAAGYTLKLPDREKYLKTKSEFLSEISALLGGCCAEKIVFGEMSTGASSDLQTASEIARKLVKEYGMSEKLGLISFGEKDEMVFLGKEIGEQKNYSEKTASRIDKEVEKILKNAQKITMKVLKNERKLLDKISETLYKKETIEREEFEKIVGKKIINKKGK